MKTLVLVRHAKSDWNSSSGSDFDRPLNSRGLKDAPFMGELIKSKGVFPDLIYSSSAKRAKTTALAIADKLNYPEDKIQFTEKIYHGNHSEIIKLISKTDKTHQTVFLFGHNPDMTSLVSILSDEILDNMPTCGVACIDFELNDWSYLDEKKSGKLRFFEYPKLY